MLSLPGPLVSVDWVAAHRNEPTLRIADVRWSLSGPSGAERYAAAHLPAALFVDLDRHLSSPGKGPGRHPLPEPARLAAALGERGIGDEHVVVAYDDAGGSIAARLWWLYRHLGHDSACAVLDGGIGAWADAGHALTTEIPSYPSATWTPGATRDDVIGTDAVADLVGTPTVLLDARAPERYRGDTEPVDPRRGHIPGAVSAPFAANLGADGRFLSPGALRERYTAMGAASQPAVAYCGSGVSATHDLLALELAGIADARLYPGSWSDWSSDPSRPARLGAEP